MSTEKHLCHCRSCDGAEQLRSDVEFVVVANRLPVDLVTGPDGEERWQASPGGLVSALSLALGGRRAAWVGWPGVPDAAPERDPRGHLLRLAEALL